MTVAVLITAVGSPVPLFSWLGFGVACAALAQAVVGLAVGLYLGRAAIASFDELLLLVSTVAVVAAVVAFSGQQLGLVHQVELALLGAAVALLVMTGARAVCWRRWPRCQAGAGSGPPAGRSALLSPNTASSRPRWGR